DSWLRILVDERSDSPRLRAGQELADDAAGTQKERIVVAHVVNRPSVLGDVEARLPVGKIERPLALRDRIVRTAFEQARRPGVIDRASRLGVVAVAWPEDTHLPLDFLVGDAGVISDAALAGAAQLIEDRARFPEGESVRPAERTRDVLDDPPV